jgi:hypothetical protein
MERERWEGRRVPMSVEDVEREVKRRGAEEE